MKRFILSVGLMLAASFAARAQDVYTDNVVIVVDASGSMGEKMGRSGMLKIDAAKSAIKEVLRGIPPDTRIGLLVFSSRGNNGWVYPLAPRDDAKLLPAIDGLQQGGGTPLGVFMKHGANELLKARKLQYGYGYYRLLIVTDGEANDNHLVDQYTPDIISRGITMDVIGVDMRSRHTLARKVHSYRAADDPESLTRAIQQVFAEVGRADGSSPGESAFEELAGLPDALAPAILVGLAASGNDPIGSAAQATAVQPSSNSSAPVAVPAQPSTSGTQPQSRGRGFLLWVGLIAVFFGAKVFGMSSRR